MFYIYMKEIGLSLWHNATRDNDGNVAMESGWAGYAEGILNSS